ESTCAAGWVDGATRCSMTRVSIPCSASSSAAVAPAGPAPTIRTREVLISLPSCVEFPRGPTSTQPGRRDPSSSPFQPAIAGVYTPHHTDRLDLVVSLRTRLEVSDNGDDGATSAATKATARDWVDS